MGGAAQHFPGPECVCPRSNVTNAEAKGIVCYAVALPFPTGPPQFSHNQVGDRHFTPCDFLFVPHVILILSEVQFSNLIVHVCQFSAWLWLDLLAGWIGWQVIRATKGELTITVHIHSLEDGFQYWSPRVLQCAMAKQCLARELRGTCPMEYAT